MKCFKVHESCSIVCDKKNCRQWIDYEDDLNCVLIAISKNGGKQMTLREIAERLEISFVRVKQIEDSIIKKLKKTDNEMFNN